MVNQQTAKRLVEKALKARQHAYTPYSHFQVGACLLAENGKEYQGANIENASFGATICAERNAIMQAVFDGAKKIKMLAVVSSAKDFCMPCGICRQVMLEFAAPDFCLISANADGDFKTYSMEELLPHGFDHF